MAMNMKLGGGLGSLEGKLAGQPGVRNPGGLAASFGKKKKFGAAKMPNKPMQAMFGGGK